MADHENPENLEPEEHDEQVVHKGHINDEDKEHAGEDEDRFDAG